jgi:hypothetical protein
MTAPKAGTVAGGRWPVAGVDHSSFFILLKLLAAYSNFILVRQGRPPVPAGLVIGLGIVLGVLIANALLL